MDAIILYIVLSLNLTRYISGYDRIYNDIKYFVLKNKRIAKFLLPKKAYFNKETHERSQSDFNKMTYIGALFYCCNALLILSMPIFLFLTQEIKILARVFEILMEIEVIFYTINLIVQMIKRKRKDKIKKK